MRRNRNRLGSKCHRATALVVCVLLIAAAAFVIDVLSPLTPTPTAIGARLIRLQLILALVFLAGIIMSIGPECFSHEHSVYFDKRVARSMPISSIRILLC
jgi:hypothetical protein